MMKIKLTILIIGLLITNLVKAQNERITNEKEKVLAVVHELFDGYRAGDSSRVASVFAKGAMLQSIYLDSTGVDRITDAESIKGFVDYVGGGFKVVHDERLWDTQVHADQLFGTVWTKYAFFLGDKFNHCGTETFLLRKVNNEWKIFYLVDTRQKKDCELPADVKK